MHCIFAFLCVCVFAYVCVCVCTCCACVYNIIIILYIPTAHIDFPLHMRPHTSNGASSPPMDNKCIIHVPASEHWRRQLCVFYSELEDWRETARQCRLIVGEFGTYDLPNKINLDIYIISKNNNYSVQL